MKTNLELQTAIKDIAEESKVKLPNSWKKTDEVIANEVLDALDENWSVPKGKIIVKVENAWVTLEGQLSWDFQRDAAISAVYYLKGVEGVSNNIKIKPEPCNDIEEREVEIALSRSLSVDDSAIKISVSGTTVTLTGNVNCWHQKAEAGRIAWNTLGIWNVKNELLIHYGYASS